jgi:hypothetical protein
MNNNKKKHPTTHSPVTHLQIPLPRSHDAVAPVGAALGAPAGASPAAPISAAPVHPAAVTGGAAPACYWRSRPPVPKTLPALSPQNATGASVLPGGHSPDFRRAPLLPRCRRDLLQGTPARSRHPPRGGTLLLAARTRNSLHTLAALHLLRTQPPASSSTYIATYALPG